MGFVKKPNRGNGGKWTETDGSVWERVWGFVRVGLFEGGMYGIMIPI